MQPKGRIDIQPFLHRCNINLIGRDVLFLQLGIRIVGDLLLLAEKDVMLPVIRIPGPLDDGPGIVCLGGKIFFDIAVPALDSRIIRDGPLDERLCLALEKKLLGKIGIQCSLGVHPHSLFLIPVNIGQEVPDKRPGFFIFLVRAFQQFLEILRSMHDAGDVFRFGSPSLGGHRGCLFHSLAASRQDFQPHVVIQLLLALIRIRELPGHGVPDLHAQVGQDFLVILRGKERGMRVPHVFLRILPVDIRIA